METKILIALNFDLIQSTAFYFFNLINESHKLSPKPYNLGLYILELCLLDLSCYRFNSLELATGVFFLISKILKDKISIEEMMDFTGVSH